jgi:hypothetical protein
MSWQCYFTTADGVVLVSQECWDEPEQAAMQGRAILTRPDAYQLLDPDDLEISALIADPSAGFTVEETLTDEGPSV